MSSHNPFAHMDEKPVQPPFLVRETDPQAVVERHRQRMAHHPAGQADIRLPQRSNVAWRGKTALGLLFDQQEAVIDALTGAYAEKHWKDMWAALYKRWGLGDILDTILTGGPAQPDRVRRVLAPLLVSLSPEIDPEVRALLFLFRAWLLRHQVVVERRPMSLIPVVGGEQMGSVTTFTPVLKRLDVHLWRLGWPHDSRPDSPRLIPGTVSNALGQAWPLFNRRYFEEQKDARPDPDRRPEHIYLLPWSDRLRQKKRLEIGQASLEEVSHNSLFRLHLPDGRRFILRSDPLTAVQAGLLAANGSDRPEIPPLAEINAAYLAAMTRRGETAQSCEQPQAADVKPFDNLQPATAYVVNIESPRGSRREITVTWVSGHDQALAVVSGQPHPARAVVIFNTGRERLGIAPVDYRTRRPDFEQLWAYTPVDGLDWQDRGDRLAVTHWAAWVWHEKAGSHLPPGGGRL